MSGDNARRSPSPDSSGEASPPARAPRRQFDEEEPRRQDKNYRRYAAGIERALASFDNARLEWPDYISFLGRLLKAIQAHPPAVDSLPHRFAVANHLAQCLKPSLPSGVHQKTIEVYSYIFALIGKDNLALDLYVYLPGLSSVLTFASLSLRPSFLSLIETHILALDGAALRPALKALILSLVPGLEDETSEDFDRTLRIVDSLKDAVATNAHHDSHDFPGFQDEYFWQCFFLASISGSSRRQGSLAFLSRRLPRFFIRSGVNGAGDDGTESKLDGTRTLPLEAESAVSPEPGLLIRCLAAGLEDEQMLIQRGYLDLLLTHLPLHSPVLEKRVDYTDLIRLIGAATSVVARRDMSLNRRLWSWFLGPETVEDVDDDGNAESAPPRRSPGATAYFARYGAKPLIESILEKLSQNPSQPSLRARPFRTCLSLMDRWEIGKVVVPKVFLPAMENISRYQKTATDADFQETLRSANSFFDGVESGIIWSQIFELSTLKDGKDVATNNAPLARFELASFILDHFNVQEEEMLFVHLPLVMLASLASIASHITAKAQTLSIADEEAVGNALLLVEKLVNLMPERAELNSSFAQLDADIEDTAEESHHSKVVRLIHRFYSDSQGNLSISPPPLSSKKISELLISEITKLLLSELDLSQTSPNVRVQAGILSSLIGKLPVSEAIDYIDTFQKLYRSLQNTGSKSSRTVPFSNLNAIAILLGNINSSRRDNEDLDADGDFSNLISCLAEAVWDYLSPSYPKFHLEAVRCLWQLDDLIVHKSLIEALIAKRLGPCISRPLEAVDSVEIARKFTVLWTHTTSQGSQSKRYKTSWSKSFLAIDQTPTTEITDYQRRLLRPLFLLLDASDEADSELQFFTRSWFENLTNSSKIFDVLLMSINETLPASTTIAETEATRTQLDHQDRSPDCLYFLQRLSGLLSLSTDITWSTLCQTIDNGAIEGSDEPSYTTMLQAIAQTCLKVMRTVLHPAAAPKLSTANFIQRCALSILRKILMCPDPSSLQVLKVEEPIIDVLRQSLQSHSTDSLSQVALLDTLSAALKVRSGSLSLDSRPKPHKRQGSVDTLRSVGKGSAHPDPIDTAQSQDQLQRLTPPANLIKCLQEGLRLSSSATLLEKWIQFLVQVLPLFSSALFQNLIPLVETFCRRISTMFEDLKKMFKDSSVGSQVSPETALVSLLNGLEATLTAGHEQMSAEEPKRAAPKSPEPQQGFFGNVVSGVFATDSYKTRNSTANSRLTVILCFQDALRVCLSIWSWGGISQKADQQDPSCLASFAYVSQRLRNKTRRILDRMFVAETLECVETIISIWLMEDQTSDTRRSSSPISLLHVLEGSSPKRTMPALFNSIYSRTTPASISSSSASTMTSELTDVEIAEFLVEYTQSLDDDAMDEIWNDCMTFLRDVLTNPLPHSHILPKLLLFLVILAEKMDKTNFGEPRKMRKELGDLFLRHLTATFTTKSAGSHQEMLHSRTNSEKPGEGDAQKRRQARRKPQYLDFVDTLIAVVPRLSSIITDNDRLLTAVANITTGVVSPLVHSKSFPLNMKQEYLTLWLALVRNGNASRVWRKDITDAFMHPKFFSTDASLALSGWAPLIYQWTLIDKERVADLCGRIAAPTSAGLMFGVGASTARLDADKKTQLNLRRLAFLIIVAEDDFAVASLATLEEKIGDLLNATSASSPSSATRAELFMLLRALIIKTNPMHLSFLWPLVTAELQRAISSTLPRNMNDFDTYGLTGLLQACKLLDLLVALAPDDFQVHEWLFITDTIDAVYRPTGTWEPIALVDDVAEELGSSSAIDTLPSPVAQRQGSWASLKSPSAEHRRTLSGGSSGAAAHRTPLLDLSLKSASHGQGSSLAEMSKDEFVLGVLRPFFAQLSMHAYEATYSMVGADVEACRKALARDLFDDSTLVA